MQPGWRSSVTIFSTSTALGLSERWRRLSRRGFEFHQSIAIVQVQGERMKHVEAEHPGNVKPCIVIDRREIPVEHMALSIQ